VSVLTHRLKGDTSPLAGLLLANAVRGCEPPLAEDVAESRFPPGNRSSRRRKEVKPLRPRSLGTKLTEVEYARVEAAALKAGVGLSEWCRRAVLEFAERDGSLPAEKVVLAELLSLRSVLLSVVFQMSKGQAVSEEEMRRLIERADREKHKKATALLDEGRDREQQ
jgi:hypothetical protein